jgi:hypothetical protein
MELSSPDHVNVSVKFGSRSVLGLISANSCWRDIESTLISALVGIPQNYVVLTRDGTNVRTLLSAQLKKEKGRVSATEADVPIHSIFMVERGKSISLEIHGVIAFEVNGEAGPRVVSNFTVQKLRAVMHQHIGGQEDDVTTVVVNNWELDVEDDVLADLKVFQDALSTGESVSATVCVTRSSTCRSIGSCFEDAVCETDEDDDEHKNEADSLTDERVSVTNEDEMAISVSRVSGTVVEKALFLHVNSTVGDLWDALSGSQGVPAQRYVFLDGIDIKDFSRESLLLAHGFDTNSLNKVTIEGTLVVQVRHPGGKVFQTLTVREGERDRLLHIIDVPPGFNLAFNLESWERAVMSDTPLDIILVPWVERILFGDQGSKFSSSANSACVIPCCSNSVDGAYDCEFDCASYDIALFSAFVGTGTAVMTLLVVSFPLFISV